jgi:transcriptional regulator with XRE-family HTH domain
MDLRKVFAANLIRLRKKKGLNQSGLAIKAGVNRDYLNRLEQGRFHVSLKPQLLSFEKLTEKFGGGCQDSFKFLG